MHRLTLFVSLIVLLLASTDANAFRCGRQLVKEKMHEVEVRKVCGEPTTSRHLGYAVRGTFVPIRPKPGRGVSSERWPGYGHYTQEVELTEYVYNFGPRKLMRRLLFEAGVLVRIESLGYGYHEKRSR